MSAELCRRVGNVVGYPPGLLISTMRPIRFRWSTLAMDG